MLNTGMLQRRMETLQITQSQLAREICVKSPDFCQKINNIRAMSLGEAEKIAEALQIRDEEFATYFFAS